MPQLEIEQGDITLVLNTQGPRKGPTILFLHASGQSRSVWMPVFTHLRPRHWQLVAPDLRGHGESTCTKTYRVEDFITDGHRILDQLNGRPVVVVGDSLGGLLALLLARHYPTRIDGLVLLSAASHPATLQWQDTQMLGGLAGHDGSLSTLDSKLASGQLTRDLASDPHRLFKAGRAVSVPTLFLHGEQSSPCAPDLDKLRRDIPHVEIAAVNAGQSIPRDNPQALANHVADFVPTLIPEIIH